MAGHAYVLGAMTTIEAEAAATRNAIVLIPAGAFEQHGPGLPLATDLIRAEAVCALVAERSQGAVVIGPSIPVGVSPHHMAFAGTVSLTTATFAAVVREYLLSLYQHGWRRIMIVTGHGGNNATLTTVAQDFLVTVPDLQLAWSPLTPLAKEDVAALGVSEIHGHSGEAETAQMLHLASEYVHTDRLEPGTTQNDQLDQLSRLARAQVHPTLTLPYDRLSDNGVLGDPCRATADAGAAIVETIVQRITVFVDEWASIDCR